MITAKQNAAITRVNKLAGSLTRAATIRPELLTPETTKKIADALRAAADEIESK